MSQPSLLRKFHPTGKFIGRQTVNDILHQLPEEPDPLSALWAVVAFRRQLALPPLSEEDLAACLGDKERATIEAHVAAYVKQKGLKK
jgi:hypothetical protein